MDEKIVIIGGGMVAGYAAKQMVELGLKPDALTIFSMDTAVPYERPPLSKGFLAGKDTEDGIQISPGSFYEEHGIELKLRTEVGAIDGVRKRIMLPDGKAVPFDKLIIATGAQVKKLDLPGASLSNVLYLRSIDDSKAIRERAGMAQRAVVIGSGFIGMEVASVLAQQGIETTMVLRDDRIWKNFFTPKMSTFFESYYKKKGVQFAKSATVKELRGEGAVNGVVLADHTIDCDVVVAGVGVTPVTAFLDGSGVELENGVKVNEYLETNRADVFAAGDVANYPDLIFGKRRRVEHWDNAVSQGQHVARVVMGERTPFRHVPYFFSDVFDLSYEFWGDTEGAEETVFRGDPKSNSFSVWWLKNGALAAAFTMNRPVSEREAAPKWIESGTQIDASNLEDEKKRLTSAAK